MSKVNGVCPSGYEELYPLLGMKGHTGIDLGATRGQPIYASQDGFVYEIATEPERGMGVDVITNERFDMGGTHYAKYRNWHMLSLNVLKGQKVRVGDLLGYADNTGFSSGDHDHFELKPVEKDSNGNWYNVFQDNGYFGSIDPEPFWNGLYAVDQASLILRLRIQILEIMIKLLRIKG